MFFKKNLTLFKKWASIVFEVPLHNGIFSTRKSRNVGSDNAYRFFKQEERQLFFLYVVFFVFWSSADKYDRLSFAYKHDLFFGSP